MSAPTVQVFISSTWLDLQPERKAVEAVLQRMRETKFVGMEYFGSRDETTQRASLDEVDRSDVYVGLFGGRYGSGITKDEYRRARERGLPCFVYFKAESAIAPDKRDNNPRLAALKADLLRAHTVVEFSDPTELAAKVTADLHRWLFGSYLTARLEEVSGGTLPRGEARDLLKSIKDFRSVNPHLLARLRQAGLAIASGERSVAIGGDAGGATVVTGSGNVLGGITGDGNVVGNDNTVSVTKTATSVSGASLPEFMVLLGQLREALGTVPLDEKTRKVVQADLEAVVTEAGDTKPSAPIIATKLKGIEAMVTSAQSLGSTTLSLMPLLQKAISWALELFR